MRELCCDVSVEIGATRSVNVTCYERGDFIDCVAQIRVLGIGQSSVLRESDDERSPGPQQRFPQEIVVAFPVHYVNHSTRAWADVTHRAFDGLAPAGGLTIGVRSVLPQPPLNGRSHSRMCGDVEQPVWGTVGR